MTGLCLEFDSVTRRSKRLQIAFYGSGVLLMPLIGLFDHAETRWILSSICIGILNVVLRLSELSRETWHLTEDGIRTGALLRKRSIPYRVIRGVWIPRSWSESDDGLIIHYSIESESKPEKTLTLWPRDPAALLAALHRQAPHTIFHDQRPVNPSFSATVGRIAPPPRPHTSRFVTAPDHPWNPIAWFALVYNHNTHTIHPRDESP